MHALQPGEHVTVRGPRNGFPFVGEGSALFVAGGIGIHARSSQWSVRQENWGWTGTSCTRAAPVNPCRSSTRSQPGIPSVSSCARTTSSELPTTTDLLGRAPGRRRRVLLWPDADARCRPPRFPRYTLHRFAFRAVRGSAGDRRQGIRSAACQFGSGTHPCPPTSPRSTSSRRHCPVSGTRVSRVSLRNLSCEGTRG